MLQTFLDVSDVSITGNGRWVIVLYTANQKPANSVSFSVVAAPRNLSAISVTCSRQISGGNLQMEDSSSRTEYLLLVYSIRGFGSAFLSRIEVHCTRVQPQNACYR